MHISIISQFYDPEPEPIPHQIAKGMVTRGHKVTVITGFPNYPYGRIFPGYKQKMWQWEELDGGRVLRLPLYPDRSYSHVRRLACYFSLALSASLAGPIAFSNADVIFVYHPITLCIPAWMIGFTHKVPFVINIQDMYPESLTSTQIVKDRRVINAVDKFAKFMYKKAAAIAVISPGFKRNLCIKGVPEERIHVIYNWADESIFYPAPRNEALATEYGFAGKFNILYAGSMGPPQGLHNVIDAASFLTDIKDLQFVFIGDGLERESLENETRDRNLKNVFFLPRQPVSKMPAFSALADIQLVHLIDSPLFEITIPSKTQSCLACGRPIIICGRGDAKELVLRAGAGVSVQPSDPQDLARAVRDLYKMTPAERQVLGDSGRRFFLENLTLDIALSEYENLFANVVSNFNRRNKCKVKAA